MTGIIFNLTSFFWSITEEEKCFFLSFLFFLITLFPLSVFQPTHRVFKFNLPFFIILVTPRIFHDHIIPFFYHPSNFSSLLLMILRRSSSSFQSVNTNKIYMHFFYAATVSNLNPHVTNNNRKMSCTMIRDLTTDHDLLFFPFDQSMNLKKELAKNQFPVSQWEMCWFKRKDLVKKCKGTKPLTWRSDNWWHFHYHHLQCCPRNNQLPQLIEIQFVRTGQYCWHQKKQFLPVTTNGSERHCDGHSNSSHKENWIIMIGNPW